MAYVKLFSTILDSTLWEESVHVRMVWITMLVMADEYGEVGASVPGLAKRAGVDRAHVEQALASFLAPDPDSRSKENEGRRIEEIDGGWRLLNHDKYRRRRTPEEDRKRNAEKQQRWRDRNQNVTVTGKVTVVTDVDQNTPIRSEQIRADQIRTNKDTEGALPLPADAGVSVAKHRDPKPEKFAAEVLEVYEHWISERQRLIPGSGAPKLDGKRKTKVRHRLTEGRTVTDLKRAVTGMLRTGFNVDGGFTDLELACRDDEHVVQFMAKLTNYEAIDREQLRGMSKQQEAEPAFDWQREAAGR